MKKILAISGGVDSMVMLDIFVKKFDKTELVVATFDHSARESSKEDCDFVSEVCSALEIPVYRGKAEKLTKISEEKARALRYDFLRKIAFKEKGEIFTAHHLDDLVETITINLFRGTGFRGLACLSSPGIRRPFLDGLLDPEEFGFSAFDKSSILTYASKNDIHFRLDPTNETSVYLRNRVREKTRSLPLEKKLTLFELWQAQKSLVKEIDSLTESILPENLIFSRSIFSELNDSTSLEILRAALLRAGVSTTIPQRKEFLTAIRTYASEKMFNLPKDKMVKIHKQNFML
ncbi:tRNA lysidine(34) synthetase TilS [Candidatus Saccharibacteria bacterium]|nr:tRNA lysidine(34) synthetase TilS [Candidatus Saccharibacteria bacterium]